jgi:hypothetical protein
MAGSFVPILTTIGAEAQAVFDAERVHGGLELELLPHQLRLVQTVLRQEDHIQILGA